MLKKGGDDAWRQGPQQHADKQAKVKEAKRGRDMGRTELRLTFIRALL